MIALENVWKSYGVGRKQRVVAQGVDVVLPAGCKIALLGAKGMGKSSMLKLMSGLEAPDRGAIRRSGLHCWPLNYFAFLETAATFQQNANTIGHIYDVDPDEVAEIAAYVSGAKIMKSKPLKRYSNLERRDIALGLTLALQFDWYFVDDALPTIPPERMVRVDAIIADRMSRASVVWATSDAGFVSGFCDAGVVLHRGKLTFYDKFETASEAYLTVAGREGAKRR